MKLLKRVYILLIGIGLGECYSQQVVAQDTTVAGVVTLEQAIDLAIRNNPTIQVQRKFVEIAENEVYRGNAGLLPTINLIGNGEYSSNATDLTIRTFAENPPEVSLDEDGVTSQTISAVVQADYVLLGGFSGRYRYEILQNNARINTYQQEALINAVVLSVSELFLEVAKLQSREELLEETITLSRERLDKAKERFSFGRSTGLDTLRAHTDLNRDLDARDNNRLAKNSLMKDLNFLVGLAPESDYRVAVEYSEPGLPAVDDIRAEVLRNNPNVKASEEQVLLTENQRRLTQSNLYPRISAYANYGYFSQENDLQQLAEINTLGYTAGISLSYNLFNGNQTRKQLQNNRLATEAQELQQQLVRDELISRTIKAYSNLQYLQSQLLREEQNLGAFTESFTRTRERYYNGKATSLDVRDAQNAQLNAKISIRDTQAELIKAYLRLEELQGHLVAN